MYELYVSLRALRLFFLSPSAPAALVLLAVFFALDSALAGALEAVVEAGALLAVDAGCGKHVRKHVFFLPALNPVNGP